jgi:hypothetical protein
VAQKPAFHNLNRPVALLLIALCILSLGFIVTTRYPEDTNAIQIGNLTACSHCAFASLFAPAVSIWDVQFSSQNITTNGGYLIVNGTLENHTVHQYVVTPYISTGGTYPGPFRIENIGYLLFQYYPPAREQASWYFKTENHFSNPIVIKPSGKAYFEIKAYALKAGYYSIVILLMSDHGNLNYREGGGYTIFVGGSTTPTIGEITHVYLPFIIAGIAIPFSILRANKVAKTTGRPRLEMGIRIYFAAKFALEVGWFSGSLVWLVSDGYSLIYPYGTVIITAIALTVIVASISAGSYFAATIRSKKKWTKTAITVSLASIVFYLFTLSGSPLIYGPRFNEFTMHAFVPFNDEIFYAIHNIPAPAQLPLFWLVFLFDAWPVNANVVAAILIGIAAFRQRPRKEPARTKRSETPIQ